MRKIILAGTVSLFALTGATCSAPAPGAPPALTQAQMQQNLQSALFILKTVGCIIDTAAQVAAPVVQISSNAQGQQILNAADASGKLLCAAPVLVPPTALPAPAPAGAPPATLAVPAA